TFFEERLGFIQQVLQRAEMAFKQVQEVSLFEVDVG
ncbi:Primase 1, partial [human gut metagenome]